VLGGLHKGRNVVLDEFDVVQSRFSLLRLAIVFLKVPELHEEGDGPEGIAVAVAHDQPQFVEHEEFKRAHSEDPGDLPVGQRLGLVVEHPDFVLGHVV